MKRSRDFPPSAWELALGAVLGVLATYLAGVHDAGRLAGAAVIVPFGWYCRSLGAHWVAERRRSR
jgi:hypothetical protein